MKNIFLFTAFFGYLISNGQSIDKEQFCTKWEVEKVSLNGEDISLDIRKYYQFNNNGTYVSFNDEQDEYSGNWKIDIEKNVVELYGSDGELKAVAHLDSKNTFIILPVVETQANGVIKLEYFLKASN